MIKTKNRIIEDTIKKYPLYSLEVQIKIYNFVFLNIQICKNYFF
jgi:hypothetical protein